MGMIGLALLSCAGEGGGGSVWRLLGGSCFFTGAGAGPGEGAGADDVLVGVACSWAGAGLVEEDDEGGGGDEAQIAPLSKLTRFGGAVLPEKNSSAVRDGSADSAGG